MNIFSRVLVSLAAAGLLSGCLSHTKLDESTGYIRLSPAIGCGTRAGEDYITFPEDKTFRLFALSEDSGDKYLDNVLVNYRGSRGWLPEGTPFWPQSEALRFIGYYPAELPMTCAKDGSLKMESYAVPGNGEDILVTDLTKALTKNDSIAGLPFHHALTKVDFRVMHGLSSSTRVRVERIGLKKVYTRGGFDSSSSLCWSPAGEPEDITVFEADGEGAEVFSVTPRTLGDSMLLLPQDNASSIEITYAFSTGGSGWITGQKMSTSAISAWEPDRHYTYTLKIQEDRLACTSGISSWYDEDAQN